MKPKNDRGGGRAKGGGRDRGEGRDRDGVRDRGGGRDRDGGQFSANKKQVRFIHSRKLKIYTPFFINRVPKQMRFLSLLPPHLTSRVTLYSN